MIRSLRDLFSKAPEPKASRYKPPEHEIRERLSTWKRGDVLRPTFGCGVSAAVFEAATEDSIIIRYNGKLDELTIRQTVYWSNITDRQRRLEARLRDALDADAAS